MNFDGQLDFTVLFNNVALFVALAMLILSDTSKDQKINRNISGFNIDRD